MLELGASLEIGGLGCCEGLDMAPFWHKCQRFSGLLVGTCSGLLVGILWEGVGSKVALLEDGFYHNSGPFFAKL